MKKLIIAAAAFAALALPSFAQTILATTTLSSAITLNDAKQIVVASATGISAPSQPSNIQLASNVTYLYVDKELLAVEAVNGTTLTVIRAQGGTRSAHHASGALVFIGTPTQFFSDPPDSSSGDPAGGCTRSNLPYPDTVQVLPFINVSTGNKSDCLNGQWVTGVNAPVPQGNVINPPTGGTIYTSINTNGTTLGATTLYCSEVFLPANKLLTGIALLNGTTAAGTDKHYVILYDAGGTAITNSALAGTATSGASEYQAFAFTSKYYAVGPADYFACFQSNGTTDTVRMALTQVNDNILTKGQTGATFGTVPVLTVPTTFTTAVGPYVYLY